MKETLTIVVPTYGRDEVLVHTLHLLLALEPAADEIVVVDQTRDHGESTAEELLRLHDADSIRWLRLDAPSIPGAMNAGLRSATSARVLFVDDDIEPHPSLVSAHLAAARRHDPQVVVAGQVLQPGESPEPREGPGFAFYSSVPQPIDHVMGGNFSVERRFALELGGFDENFVGAAYCFEADFSRRALAAGATIQFEPGGSIRHLRAERGGTRGFGSHLRTHRPHHAVGEYYFLLKHKPPGWLGATLRRPVRAITTRYHLRRPWWIPISLFAELSGLFLARRLEHRGPKLLGADEPAAGSTEDREPAGA